MVPTPQMPGLETLPQDLLGDIISRVAQYGRCNIRQCMKTSTTLASAANDKRVYKNLNLRPLAMNPLATLHNYQDLMEKCLENGNPEAHYIEGIKEYFHHNNTTAGLAHLQASAEGAYDEGIYLYGLIILCRGSVEEGKKYLDKLKWKQCKRRADRCWRNNQISLREIPIIKKPLYRQTLRNNRPPRRCHPNDMDNRCNRCFYYKQMKKFMNHP